MPAEAQLSALVHCRRDARRAAATARRLAPAVDEVLVAGDAAVGRRPLRAVAAIPGVRVLRLPAGATPERAMAYLHAQCAGAWVLWVEEDETPAPWLLGALRELIADPGVTHYRLPRDAPWPGLGLRLVRNDPALLDFPGLPDAPVRVAGPGRILDRPALLRAPETVPALPRRGGRVAEATRAGVDALWAGRRLPDDAYHARVEIIDPDLRFAAGGGRTVHVAVENRGTEHWPGGDRHPLIRLSYRWLRPDGSVLVAEGLRSALCGPLGPGERAGALLSVAAPPAGEHVLEVDLVHEHRRWFGFPVRAAVTVSAPEPALDAGREAVERSLPGGDLAAAGGDETGA